MINRTNKSRLLELCVIINLNAKVTHKQITLLSDLKGWQNLFSLFCIFGCFYIYKEQKRSIFYPYMWFFHSVKPLSNSLVQTLSINIDLFMKWKGPILAPSCAIVRKSTPKPLIFCVDISIRDNISNFYLLEYIGTAKKSWQNYRILLHKSITFS